MEKSGLRESPHRRYNILTGEWVLVSPHRNKRPWQGKTETVEQKDQPAYDAACYLCPGNTRSNGIKNDEYEGTFAFTNDFSALLSQSNSTEMVQGLLKAKGEKGICRVLCYAPNHSLTMPQMELVQIEQVIQLWQKEYLELGQKAFINHVQIFENKGAVMGCSNPHPHGQIWAQESIPLEVQKKSEAQKKYFKKNGESLLSAYLKQEIEDGSRIVLQTEHYVALVPFWAVWPFELMIIPTGHQQHITAINGEQHQAFAKILKETTQLYDRLFNTSFPYSAGIHQAPTNLEDQRHWHWHFSFYPPLLRSATVKKFMVGYEMFGEPQRDITAETAAEQLRALIV